MAYHRTSYAVWEITLKCNLACSHCGSRAGDARTEELSTEEALDLVRQMAEVGIKEVTLIGGEAFLRPDWLEIAAAINQAGMRCTMTTGGYGITLATAHKMKAAGIATVSVSIDGLDSTHDTIRGRTGAWRYAFKTMVHLQEVGIPFGCNTQINRLSAPELPSIYEHIRDAGAVAWQLQLTVPMGHAADNSEILLQPYELLALYPMLARIASRAKREGIQLQPGNNIGYYGPYERLLRGRGQDNDWAFWQGCSAGLLPWVLRPMVPLRGARHCQRLPILGEIFAIAACATLLNPQRNSGLTWGQAPLRELTTCGDFAKPVSLPNSVAVAAPGRPTCFLTGAATISTVTIGP